MGLWELRVLDIVAAVVVMVALYEH